MGTMPEVTRGEKVGFSKKKKWKTDPMSSNS